MARKTLAYLKGANRDFNNVLDSFGTLHTEQTATTAADLSSTGEDLVWYSNVAQAGAITFQTFQMYTTDSRCTSRIPDVDYGFQM